ncbi:PepSY domain-containing protein [Phenylobacterium montanum]|uniref:PepSY domain-containing protein n=2 Tax=Phenylobacterium montanum TaxID=2823693 RepID=A0A975G564_9CAUL|nr:PepSY domain-containing protein [Caulobacter sp. S6]
MMKRRVLILALAATSLIAPGLALAQQGSDSLGADYGLQQNDVRQCVKQGGCVPLSKVIAEINRRSPGRELDAGLEQSGDRIVYRVRWAGKDGRRIDYIVDAHTGAVISAK